MEPFVPQIYSIGSRSRYWPYGAPYIRTPIPGAGFKGRSMYYEAQPLLLGSTGGDKSSRVAALRTRRSALRDHRQSFEISCRRLTTLGSITRRGLRAAIKHARELVRDARRRGIRDERCVISFAGGGPPVALVDSLARVRPANVPGVGLGQDVDPGRAATVVANLLIDPDRELTRRGDAIAAALDRHVATPLIESMGRQMQPYFWKWVFPPLLVLYAISSVAAIKAWQAETRLAQGR